MKLSEFLKKKDIEISAKRYFVDAMGAMAHGLFASLLIGTIFKSLGLIPGLSIFVQIGGYAQAVAGSAMAVAIANALHAPAFVMYSAAAVGYAANALGGAGGPIAVFLIALVAVELGKAVSKETKIDIIVTPFVTVVSGGLLSILVAPSVGKIVGLLSNAIGWAMTQQPFVVGILVSVIMGISLTLPISSAAICAGLGLSGMAQLAADGSVLSLNYEGLALAGGAAVAGCCAHMVGFAVMSFKENRWGGLLAQGLGTSMLQMGNIVKKPVIWLAPILASAVTGPISTMVFGLQCKGVAAGMGTCGLVGPIGVIDSTAEPDVMMWIGLAAVCVVLPALLSILFNEILRKLGWIQTGDMKIDA